MDRKRIVEVNQVGLENKEAFWSWYTPVLQIAFELGQIGIDLSAQPEVCGYRYGKVPKSGLSTNYRDEKSERGLSLANLEGEEEVGSVVWFADREKVKVDGLLLPYRGSDGEPLILPFCVEDLD